MVTMDSFGGKDARPPINTKATNIPKAPYPRGSRAPGRGSRWKEDMFTGAQLHLDFNYLEIKSSEGTLERVWVAEGTQLGIIHLTPLTAYLIKQCLNHVKILPK